MSGATTSTILEKPQWKAWRRFSPQMDGIPVDADLITVTAGGNDLRYAGAMLFAALAGWLRARPATRPIGKSISGKAAPAAMDADVARVASGLERVVEAARRRAPRAHDLLVDYLTVLAECTRPGPAMPLEGAEITAFRRIADRLAAAFADAAQRTGADLVQASVLSVDHALGSAEPWVRGLGRLTGPTPFHPNAAGMRAVAEAIYEQLMG